MRRRFVPGHYNKDLYKKIIGFDTMDKEFWWIPYGDGYCDD